MACLSVLFFVIMVQHFNEGDEVIAEAEKGRLVIRVLRPQVVDVDPASVEKLLSEKYELEREI